MNRYAVSINNRAEIIESASACRIAVDRAMGTLPESEFKPQATIRVRFVGKVEYEWYIVADTPFDFGAGGMGHSRQTVSPAFKMEKEADIEMQRLSVANSNWKHIRLSKRIKA